MPILIYNDGEGHYREQELSNKKELIRIGSDPDNDIVFSSTLGVASKHAIVLRSAVNFLPVVVNLAGQNTRVNGRRVLSIQVLRQKDTLQLGQAQLTLWEIRITVASPGQRAIGQVCQVCLKRVEAGDEVVICPRCSTPSHRLCWFSIERCAKYGCNYPIKERVMEALSSKVTFEHLEANSELIKLHKKCQALTLGDQIAFQAGEDVAYCPSVACQAPYHFPCWFNLERCICCGYEIQELLDKVFSSSSSNLLQTGGGNVK